MSKFFRRWRKQLVQGKFFSGLSKYPGYFSDWSKYGHMESAEPIRLKDSSPCLFDSTATSGVDRHYFYQHIWAAAKIHAQSPAFHVDVGSNVNFVGFLTTITKVCSVDIRPLVVSNVSNLECIQGSVLDMPFENGSIGSLSCLHVIEHVGLGRYGDKLDPLGTKKAAAELSRVLAVGGDLYVALPVGKPRVCFNAHRIHEPGQVQEYFSGLKLVEFAGTNDNREFLENAKVDVLAGEEYGCGMFRFTKE